MILFQPKMKYARLVVLSLMLVGLCAIRVHAQDPQGTRRPKLVVTDTNGNVTILQPTAGLNNGTDDGSATKGKDGWAYLGDPSRILGAEPSCGVYSSPCNVVTGYAYIQFSLADMPIANIASAQIQLYTGVTHPPTCGIPWPEDPVFGLRNVTSDWNEMTLNWYVQPAYDTTPITSYTFTGVAGLNDVAAYEWVSYDITDLYRGWANGTVPNYGVRISHDNPFCMNCDNSFFYSSDDGLTSVTYTGPTDGNYGEPATVSATLVDAADGSVAVGRTLSFTVGTQSCTGTTDGSGQASCVLTPSGGGTQTITVSFAGDSQYQASTTTAQFQINGGVVTYTITASADTNGSITPSGSVSVSSGDSQAFVITPNPGYHIADVLVDGGSVGAVGSYPFTGVSANHTISATFAINTYTITASVAGDAAGGSVSPASQMVNYGDAATFTVNTNAGYTAAVSEGTLVSGTWTIPNVTSTHTITVTFSKSFMEAKTKDQCKANGWQHVTRADGSTFKNQGDCIQYVNTGK